MEFNAPETDILKRLKCTSSDVYDASSAPTAKSGGDIAKSLGKPLIIYGHCARDNTRLKTRSGHCVYCNPRAYTEQQRSSTPGYVYLAGSINKKWIKVGGTSEPLVIREKLMNLQKYGQTDDWRMVVSYRVMNFGRVEDDVQALLKGFRVYGQTYLKENRQQEAIELFACSILDAKRALDEASKHLTFQSGDKKIEPFHRSYLFNP